MNNTKALIIFMVLSVVLLFGISLLPESPIPLLEPASVTVTTAE